MSQPLPPWSLHWNSNGELSPMDRAELARLVLSLHRPAMGSPFRGALSTGTRQHTTVSATAENLLFPHR